MNDIETNVANDTNDTNDTILGAPVWSIGSFSFRWVQDCKTLYVFLNGTPYSNIKLPNFDTETLAREFSCNWAAEFFSNGLAAVAKFRRDIR